MSDGSDMGPLMRPDEVANFLSKSVASVYRLMRTGRLRATKIGGEWRISRGALMELLEDGITMRQRSNGQNKENT